MTTYDISKMLDTQSPPSLLVTRIPVTDSNSDDSAALAALIAGIVGAVLLALICVIAVCLWWLARRKGSYVTNETDEDDDYVDNDEDESFFSEVALECKEPLRAAEDEP